MTANPLTGARIRHVECDRGRCVDCGSNRHLTGSQDVERHTRLVRGGRRVRCHGTGRKPLGWRKASASLSDSTPKD